MEDSYTVHRRRKAAARKREKTPEPPRELRAEESGEDDSVARAKMERMVEDTENMAELGGKFNPETNPPDKITEPMETPSIKSALVIPQESRVNPEIEREVKTVKKLTPNRDEPDKFRSVTETTGSVVVDEPRDSDAPNFQPPVKSEGEKFLDGRESAKVIDALPKEPVVMRKAADPTGEATRQTGNSSQNGEPLRPKKRTKEKILPIERRSYGTDSSDADEKIAVSVRRKKSPEVPRPRSSSGKSQPRSRPPPNDTDEDRNTSNNESKPKQQIREKRYPSKHRYSTGTEDDSSPKKSEIKSVEKEEVAPDQGESRYKLREKRSVSRHRYPSDTDEDFIPSMKKSQTFPQKSSDKQTIKRSASEVKKQIIPLSDDSLIQDFAKAQEEYLRRERGILAPDFMDDDYSHRSNEKALRKRKIGVLHSDPEEIVKSRAREGGRDGDKRKSWFSWVPFFRKKEKVDDPSPDKRPKERPTTEKVSFMEFLRALQDIISEFKAYVDQNPKETAALKKLRNCCIGELILVIIYCGLGAFVFRFTEGAFETFYKCGVKRVKRDFLDNLWNYSHNMREEDWKSMARRKLMEFEEQLHNAHEAGVHSYSGQKSWTFLNAVSYCLTVITTIGYGHISPRTMAGRAITIVYAIFGIPIFLIILADFGKLFTRGIKFLWAFVRRVYYTGSCRKVRRTGPVQEVMKGVQLVYDFATFRRPSQFNPEEVEEMQRQQIHTETVLNLDGNVPIPETPGTPAMSNFAIDDEFNLPISVAITILLGYIFVGATAYHMFEEWDFFESFYFVFISMSTIGFGDFVPKNPIFMMFSIIYLVFGLALTSMCINVVQTVLSDSFKQASQKISATIGFEVPPEEGEEGAEQTEGGGDAEVTDVQMTVKEAEEKREEIAPKAKQEDIDV